MNGIPREQDHVYGGSYAARASRRKRPGCRSSEVGTPRGGRLLGRRCARKESAGGALLVTEGFDRIEPRRLEGGIHAEEDPDRRGKSNADGERPPGQRDRKARDQVDRPADG